MCLKKERGILMKKVKNPKKIRIVDKLKHDHARQKCSKNIMRVAGGWSIIRDKAWGTIECDNTVYKAGIMAEDGSVMPTIPMFTILTGIKPPSTVTSRELENQHFKQEGFEPVRVTIEGEEEVIRHRDTGGVIYSRLIE